MPETVAVKLYHITLPEEWNLDYWTSMCNTTRRGQKVLLTESDNSKARLKEKVTTELAALDQTPVFEEKIPSET